jgi:predicted O-linked N-acetylglucosamine transferase (SPINDLY family)
VQALHNLAVLRESQGNRSEARVLYDKALAADASHFGARLNRAALRLWADDPQGALEDLDVLAASGPSPHVHAGRSRALLALHRDGQALEAAQAALRANPLDERLKVDRAIALASLGRLDEAKTALAGTSAERNPRLSPLAVRISRLLLRLSVCDWRERGELVDLLRSCSQNAEVAAAVDEHGLLFNMTGLALTSIEQRVLSEAALHSVRNEGESLARRAPPIIACGEARIRVGFFAAGLRVHPEAFLLRRLFTDRNRERFEYFLYALNPDDGSSLRAEIARSADQFVDASSWSSDAIVRQARADRLDIAIDVSGTYSYARPEVFAARIAPVQAAYLATPMTLGPVLHDYRLSDPWSTPTEEQPKWAEKLVLVAPTPWAYDDSIQAHAAPGRPATGLPAEGFVFACMNQAFKLEPDSFGIWMRLLRAVPGSSLWLLDAGSTANANMRREAAERGVAPGRLVLAPRVDLREHLGRLAHADLFLDTFHCNAHTTALDALWAGLPVLTRTGTTMASRLASTFVRALGLPELAVENTAAYEATALALARDAVAVRALKARLMELRRRSPLFDTAGRIRAVEEAIVEMVRRHRAGLPPETLSFG